MIRSEKSWFSASNETGGPLGFISEDWEDDIVADWPSVGQSSFGLGRGEDSLLAGLMTIPQRHTS